MTLTLRQMHYHILILRHRRSLFLASEYLSSSEVLTSQLNSLRHSGKDVAVESSLRKACLCLKFLALTWLDSNSLVTFVGIHPRAPSDRRST